MTIEKDLIDGAQRGMGLVMALAEARRPGATTAERELPLRLAEQLLDDADGDALWAVLWLMDLGQSMISARA